MHLKCTFTPTLIKTFNVVYICPALLDLCDMLAFLMVCLFKIKFEVDILELF